MIYSIWAEDKNHGIGINNTLPWSLPDDTNFFKTTTQNTVVVMGRKTYESFGSQPLPNRINMILTSNKNYSVNNDKVLIIHMPQEAIKIADDLKKDLYVIGGSSVFDSFSFFVDQLLVTQINASFVTDTKVNAIDMDKFYLANSIKHSADDKHAFSFEFNTYKRRIK